MTTTQEKIAIMQAHSEGKIIQVRNALSKLPKGWLDALGEPRWNWAAHDYRIKPEPRTVYVTEYANKRLVGVYGSYQSAHDNAARGLVRVVKFIEVIED